MGFPAFCDRFERVPATLLKGCCGLFGGMCPRGVRVYSNWRGGICGDSEHGRILVGDPLRRITDTLTKFLFVSGEGWLSGSVGKAGGVASTRGYSGCCGLRSRGVTRFGEGFGEGSGEGDIGRWRTSLLTEGAIDV